MSRQLKTSGANHNVMRELNRTLVLDVVRRSSPISRAAIAKVTGLAKPTVSVIVDGLLAAELVVEIGYQRGMTGGGGRPPMMLEFNARSQFVAGVLLGVRRITALVADATGEELGRGEADAAVGRPADVAKACAALVRQLIAECGCPRERLAAVCLVVPDPGRSDLGAPLSKALGVPVHVHTAAQAAAIAECADGAAAGATEMVLLHTGPGIGAGVVSEGRLFQAHGGIAIGHCHVPGATGRCTCGRVGCLETVAGAAALCRTAQRAMRSGRRSAILRGRGGAVAPEDLAAAAADGDALATELLAAAGHELGVATSWLVTVLGPSVVVVGGVLADAGDALLGPISETASAYAGSEVSIRAGLLGRHAEGRGALLIALQYAETFYRVVYQG